MVKASVQPAVAGNRPCVLGDLQRKFFDAEDRRDQLLAAAELHRTFSFDHVSACDLRLDHEPRCSTKCEVCQTVWIGSMAGEVLRLSFAAPGLEPAWVVLPGGVRALLHVDRLRKVIAGLDIGHLVLLDANDLTGERFLRVATTPPMQPVRFDPTLEHNDNDPNRFKYGITAITELPGEAPDAVDLVVATRKPALLAVRLTADELTILAEHPLPGWTRCLAITGARGQEVLVCATRSGEFLEWKCADLLHPPGPDREQRDPIKTSLLPTVIARPPGASASDTTLLVGASDGLHIRRADTARPVHVAVTRSAVLSIATVTVPAHREGELAKHYVVLGLEGGRLRVIEATALLAWLEGEDRPDAHNFPVFVGASVLAMEVLEAEKKSSHFVLTALRDHRLRLFHVPSRSELAERVEQLWRAEVNEPNSLTAADLDVLLEREKKLRDEVTPKARHALRYLLVHDVLPRWARALQGSDPRLVERACEITRGADKRVLYRLSATMGDIAGGDSAALLQISMACLVAMPQRDAQRWRAFAQWHLKRFHECARVMAIPDDVSRLQHWARFVRKYVYLGNAFADKQFCLADLVERNEETSKHLDALIYAAQLEKQRYDLKWSRVACRDAEGRPQEIARVEILDDIAIVITASAEVVFFDIEGEPLPIFHRDGTALERLEPLGKGSGLVRTRAARVVRRDGSHVRIALSWTGENRLARGQLPVTIFDLDLPKPKRRDDAAPGAGARSHVKRRYGTEKRSRVERPAQVTLRSRYVARYPAVPTDALKLWDEAVGHLRLEVSAYEYENWIRPIDLVSVDGVVYRLRSPNSNVRGQFESSFLGRLQAWLHERGHDIRIEFDLDGPDELRPDLAGAAGGSGARTGDIAVEVHGVVGLSGTDAFLIGLDSSESPLALLKLRSPSADAATYSIWELSPLAFPRSHSSPDAPPAVLSTPVRAVAAIALDKGRFLGGAGADDGALRFVEFDLQGNVIAVNAEPTPLFYPINDIALAVRKGDRTYSHVCYAGTATGVSLCMLVRLKTDTRPEGDDEDAQADKAADGKDTADTSEILTRQLWRDLHDGPVIAVRPTKEPDNSGDPRLYETNVVLVVTQAGHVAIYHTEPAARGSEHGALEGRISGAFNYYFEGMRFDRIDLPPRLLSWAIPRSQSHFLIAYPDGVLCFGEFVGPRESPARRHRRAAIDQIYEHVKHAELFFGGRTDAATSVDKHENQIAAPEAKKLELCGMIRIDGGALRSYILEKQLQLLRWDILDGETIEKLLHKQLSGLSAEIDEERDRIKVIIETVSRMVLDREPDKILEQCRPGRAYDRIADYPRVRGVCQFLARYLLDAALQGKHGAVRVRMVSIAALMRVDLFRYAALDEQSGRHITSALRRVLTACLRDDNAIVRVEALRAVAVALRNISVMFAHADGEAHREELRTIFFPRGLQTLQWLVSAILENYARYRRHGEPILLSTPWSYITVLVSLIRLFPEETLALCDQIAGRGLRDSLEVIHDRLRGERARMLRWRIRELYLVPSLREPAQAQAAFIKKFGEWEFSRILSDHGVSPTDADYVRANGLLHVYHRLAVLWKVTSETDIKAIRGHWNRSGDLPELTGNLAGMRKAFDTLLDIARAGPEDRPAKLRAPIASESRDGQKPPDAVRLVLDNVIRQWQAVLEPRIQSAGDVVGGHELAGVPIERANGLLFTVRGSQDRLIKVLRYRHDMNVRQEFNRDARLSREFGERYPKSFAAVHKVAPRDGYAELAKLEIANDLLTRLEPDKRPAFATAAAHQLARALRCMHAESIPHGDLRAENVFVERLREQSPTDVYGKKPPAPAPSFRLGDLHVHDGPHSSAAARQIPSFLRRRVPDGIDPAIWIDLLSLGLLLYWIRTGDRVDPDMDEQAIAGLEKTLADRAEKENDPVVRAISRLLGGTCKCAEELETLLESNLTAFERKELVGRPRAKFDVFISYDSSSGLALARDLHTQLGDRSLAPYLDDCDLLPEGWPRDIRYALAESRAFAILVGATYRKDGPQSNEVAAARKMAADESLRLVVFKLVDNIDGDFARDCVIKIESAEQAADTIVDLFRQPREIPIAALPG